MNVINVCLLFLRVTLEQRNTLYCIFLVYRLNGKRIGALKEALHDSIMIVQHGGIVYRTDYNNTVFGIMDMLKRMQKNEIDGFVVTKPIYYYFARVLKDDVRYKHFSPTVSAARLLISEMSFLRDRFVTGMMVKHKEDYEHFHRYYLCIRVFYCIIK